MSWTSLCELNELKPGEGKYVEIDGFQLAVFQPQHHRIMEINARADVVWDDMNALAEPGAAIAFAVAGIPSICTAQEIDVLQLDDFISPDELRTDTGRRA